MRCERQKNPPGGVSVPCLQDMTIVPQNTSGQTARTEFLPPEMFTFIPCLTTSSSSDPALDSIPIVSKDTLLNLPRRCNIANHLFFRKASIEHMLQATATQATEYQVGVGDGVIGLRVKVENSWNRNIKWPFPSSTTTSAG
jgi:hypothetical protein